MSVARVPFYDLAAQTAELRPALDAAIAAVLDHGRYIKGPEVAAFEREFAAYCGVAFCTGCSNGTSALHTALEAAAISPGAEVIVPSHTFIATAESVLHAGAIPIFADIDEDSMLLSPSAVEAAITPRTEAIVPVHLYGCPADMDALLAVADRHGLLVIEDAAQAQGAKYRGARVGSLGAAAAFSFFPGKNLGAFGDAGAVTTAHRELHEAAAKFVDHGRRSKYEHDSFGTNYRLDTLQAAILRVKLAKLDEWNARRAARVAEYRARLSAEPFASLGLAMQEPPEGAESANHLFVVRVANRERVQSELTARGIETGIHYPVPCHLQPAAQSLPYAMPSLPETERAAREVLSLPLSPHMTAVQVGLVCDALAEVLTSHRSLV